jgi:hypothetical protein
MSDDDIFKDDLDLAAEKDQNKSSSDPKQEEELRDRIKKLKEQLSQAEKELARIAPLSKKPASDLEGEVHYGYFDGENMVSEKGKVFAVPPNYASKSKMVEGDELKLTITPEGQFIFKQIHPAERKRLIGVLDQQDNGSYVVKVGTKPYKVILASVTYYRAKPGDEIAIIVPADKDSDYAAFDSVVSNGRSQNSRPSDSFKSQTKKVDDFKRGPKKEEPAEDSQDSSYRKEKLKGYDDNVGANLSDDRLGILEGDDDIKASILDEGFGLGDDDDKELI